MTDWVTISSLATAGGTLVLAIATFASVRSANKAARTAERSLMVNLRPLLVASRLDDSPLKVGFADGHWVHLPGGAASAVAAEEAVYLAASLRNVGTGMAVLDRWHFDPERLVGDQGMPDLSAFRRLTRDLYIAPGDIGFWQGTFREPGADHHDRAAEAVAARRAFTVDLLYGDVEGGQRTISRFAFNPMSDGEGWLLAVSRHWYVDRPAPR